MTPAVRRARLALTPPYAVVPALASLAAHAVPGTETVDVTGARVTRTVPTSAGPAVVTVWLRGTHVDVDLDLPDPQGEAGVLALVRRWLDLDVDPAAVADRLSRDTRLGPLVRARPGLRVLGHTDGFEAAVTTVLGQQVSLAAARTFAGRLVAAFGAPVSDGLRAFPRPDTLAAAGPARVREAVGLTGARAATVHALATACARGDLVLRRALGMSAHEVTAAAEAWRPVRAYAAQHLWTAAAHL